MAGGAGYRAIGGQAAIEKQFLAKGDLLRRLWIVLRDNLLCQLDREANLVKGPGLGQGTCFGNRRRLSGGLLASTDHERNAGGHYHGQEAPRCLLPKRHGGF